MRAGIVTNVPESEPSLTTVDQLTAWLRFLERQFSAAHLEGKEFFYEMRYRYQASTNARYTLEGRVQSVDADAGTVTVLYAGQPRVVALDTIEAVKPIREDLFL